MLRYPAFVELASLCTSLKIIAGCNSDYITWENLALERARVADV